MGSNNLTMLLCSCDAYSFLIDDFMRLLGKYWPDFDSSIFINTESPVSIDCGYRILVPNSPLVGMSWSDRLYYCLQQIDTDYVLLFLDDFYLNGPVDHNRFEECLQYIQSRRNVAGVTFLPEPGATNKQGPDGIVARRHFSSYLTTAHASIYRKTFLMDVLRAGESAWDFEVFGTVRSWFKPYKFYCAKRGDCPIIPYDFGALVVRGKWYLPVKRRFEQLEGLHFSDVLDDTDALPEGSGGFFKKLEYACKGLCSLASRKPGGSFED